MTNAFIAPASAHQPQRFVIGEGEDIDAARASGEWIAADADSVTEADP